MPIVIRKPVSESFFEVLLEMPEESRSIKCGNAEYILDAAARYGIRFPAICREGQCLTCAGELLSGEVDQDDARCYLPQDREAGFVLLCRGKPRGDVKIRTHRAVAMRAYRKAAGLPAPYS